MTGCFISFEGIEGLGKTTNLKHVEHYLKSQGIDVVCTREPGGTPIAERIRDLILSTCPTETMLPEVELMLVYAGRLQHVRNKIEPALAKGQWVLSDRFFDASFAYQGAGRGVDMNRLSALHHWVLGDFKPHHTFLFDAPVSLSVERLASKHKDRIEQEGVEFFERVRAQYRQLADKEPERFCLIDATQSFDNIKEQLLTKVKQWL